MHTFDDQVVIITGAGNGLGREYARLLAARGAKVVVNDYGGTVNGQPGDISAAQAVVDEIRAAGGEAVANGADVTSADAGDELAELALSNWGRIDAVINNAGATRGGVGVAENTVEDMLLTFDIHVGGAARVVRAVWPHMVERGYGRIVNTSSDSLWGTPTPNYVTAKGAVFGYTRAVAAEGEHVGIKVNTVMPSAWTRMTSDIPPGQFRDDVESNFPPERVAPFVAFLVHEECPWNGEAFQVGANRAAREFLAVTRGHIASGDDVVADFAAFSDQVASTKEWCIPSDMVDSVVRVVAELNGENGWQ